MTTEHAASTTPGALIPLGAGAVAMKSVVAEQRAESARAVAALTASMADARADLETARAAMEVSYRQQVAELAAAMAPLKAQLERLVEVAWTVDLYLGRDEQIELLVDGAPAPADTPITVRQMVLAMDEESLVLMGDGGLDARNTDAFLAWLIADPAHRDQVIPDERGVVVLVPSRQERNYGDAWVNTAIAEANTAAYWIIRNGEKLYLLRTDPNLHVGSRLLPTRSEFLDYFYTRELFGRGELVPLEPGSAEWVKAEEASDKRRRHFMRIMLVLQGLVDRTVAFAPLPEGGVNLLSLSAQDDGKVVIINELDNVLTTGREPFRAWQGRLNAQLRPGMRIIANFGRDFDSNRVERGGGNSRLHPRHADKPASKVCHLIEERASGGALLIRYERTDSVYTEGYGDDGKWIGEHKSKVRASCRLMAEDSFVLAYDLVTEAELNTYLHARTERHHYLDMVPVLQAALEAKAAERATEAPFVLMLTGLIAAAHNVDPADVAGDVADLVTWWKLANRWARPLTGKSDAETKAVAAISAEWAARKAAAAKAAGAGGRDDAMVTAGRALAGALVVARRRDGSYVVLTPSDPGANIWLNVTTLRANGATGAVREWTMLPGKSLASMTILWSRPAWADWNHGASRADHLTGPETELILAAMRERAAVYGPPVAATYRQLADYGGRSGRMFTIYAWDPTRTAPVHAWGVRDDEVGAALMSATCRWKRGPGGVVALTWGQDRRGIRWGGYTNGGMDTPWRPTGSRYLSATDHLLIWSDPAQLDRLASTHAKLAAATKITRDGAEALRVAAVGYTSAVHGAWLAAQVAAARARFDEDYGTGSDDLWEHHLGTLTLGRSWKEPAGLHALFVRLAGAGVDVYGLSVAQAIDADPEQGGLKVSDDLAGLVITAPQQD